MTYSERFTQALVVASELHRHQVRKGTTIPYVSHLLGTCSIAMEHGANEDEAIAALLHDVLEDVPGDAARGRVAALGTEVLRIVEACTDGFAEKKGEWVERKEAYLKHLESADRSVLLVSASDKLHNARSLLTDLQTVGSALWDRFTVQDPAKHLWYYEGLVAAFRGNPQHNASLVAKLDETVRAIARFVRRQFQPVFQIEKIECLVLAAHLERDGWQVRLSVPPDEVGLGPEVTGVDWAKAVAYAQRLGRPLRAADRKAAKSHEVGDQRTTIGSGLVAWVKSAIDTDRDRLHPDATDSAYRYDGIWHDDGGNVDLVAWRGPELLLVEAKGVTVRGGRVNREKAAADVAATLKRLSAWGDQHPTSRLGILIPDDLGQDRPLFKSGVAAHWQELGDHHARTTIYLVGVDGTITSPSHGDLS